MDEISKPRCEIIVSNGKILGYGSYALRTISGSKRISLPWTIDETSPAVIYNPYCSSLIFLKPNIHFYWIIPAILFILCCMILPIVIRYKRMKNELKDFGYETRLSLRGLLLNGPSGCKKISICKVLLYSYCLISNYVEPCVDTSNYIGNYTFFIGDAWIGDELCTQKDKLFFESLSHNVYLNLEYETYLSWKHIREEDWGCGGGSCPLIPDCSSMNSEETQEFRSETKLIRNFCKNYPHSCALSRGCWFGRDILTFRDKISVYSFSSIDLSNLYHLKNSDCKVMVSSNNYFNLANFKLIKHQNESFLCNQVSLRSSIISGYIGDNQIYGDGLMFNWNSVKCDESWYKMSNCSYTKHEDINKLCSKLPTIIDGLRIDEEDNQLSVRTNDNHFLISGSCKSDFIKNEDECYNIKLSIHGKRYTGFGIFLVANGYSKSNSSITISLKCKNKHHIHLLCNGEDQYFILGEDDICHNIDDFSKISSDSGVIEILESSPSVVEQLGLHDTHQVVNISCVLITILVLCVISLCCCKK